MSESGYLFDDSEKIILEEMLVFLEGDNRFQIKPHDVRTVQKYGMNLVKSYVDLKKCSWISPHTPSYNVMLPDRKTAALNV